MKSKRAIGYLRENKMGATILLYDAEQAVIIAEQDAEERYYNAVKLLLQEVRDAIKNGNSADDVLFSSLARYNCILNEGQSNE